MNLRVSNHVMERYCQRVLSMPMDDVRSYFDQNIDEIHQKVIDMLGESTCFWRGAVNDNHDIADYYFHRLGFVIVVGPEDKTIITLYQATYGIDQDIDRDIARKLFKKIINLGTELDKSAEDHAVKLAVKDQDICKIDTDIQALRDQIEFLEVKRHKIEADRICVVSDRDKKEREITELAAKLINSFQYQMDIVSLKQQSGQGYGPQGQQGKKRAG